MQQLGKVGLPGRAALTWIKHVSSGSDDAPDEGICRLHRRKN